MHYLTVGPAKINQNTKNKLIELASSDILSESHRGEHFGKAISDCITWLRKYLKIPKNYGIVFASSATESMEIIAKNTVYKNSDHLVTWVFSDRLYKVMKTNGIDTQLSDIDSLQTGSDDAKIICLTENETSASHQLPKDLLSNIRTNNPNAFIAIDTTSSAGVVEHDYSLWDYWFFSVQKGFGLPSGLWVIIYNTEKIHELSDNHTGFLRNFENMIENYGSLKTPETPNMIGYYLLADRLNQLLKKWDIHDIYNDTLEKSHFFYNHINKDFLIGWDYMSDTVFILQWDSDTISKLKEAFTKNNLIVSDGYGEMKATQLRIANFENNTLEEIQKLLEIANNI